MAITRDSLIAAYPEFSSAPTDLVDAQIENAENTIDRNVFGDAADFAVLLRACHYIAISQFGEMLSLKSDDGDTPWNRQYKELAKSAGSSWRMG